MSYHKLLFLQVTRTDFISQLIEIRLGDLYCKEIFSWSNAYDFYTEIKLLSSYAEDEIRLVWLFREL